MCHETVACKAVCDSCGKPVSRHSAWRAQPQVGNRSDKKRQTRTELCTILMPKTVHLRIAFQLDPWFERAAEALEWFGEVAIDSHRLSRAQRAGKGLTRGVTKAIVALICLLLGGSLQAAESPNLKLLTYGYAATTFADAYTSMQGFDRGFTESNPGLPERPTDSRFVAQVLVLDSAVVLAAWKLRDSHPKLARWTLITGIVLHGVAAGHNYRLLQHVE